MVENTSLKVFHIYEGTITTVGWSVNISHSKINEILEFI